MSIIALIKQQLASDLNALVQLKAALESLLAWVNERIAGQTK